MNGFADKNGEFAFITWMQMIGCALVIAGHSYPFVTAIPQQALDLRTFLYVFHMPLFVWCSGYLIAATAQIDRYNFGLFCKKRAIRILLPYFALSIVGFLPKLFFPRYLNDKVSLSVTGIIRIFLVPRENVWGHFWFLPMIFLLGLVGYGILKVLSRLEIYHTPCIEKLGILLAIGCGTFFLPQLTGWFAINDLVHYFVYYALGITCAKIATYIHTYIHTYTLGIVLCIAASIIIFLTMPHTAGMRFLISILMLMAVWGGSEKLAQFYTVNRKSIWAQTYSVFILAWPCQLIAEILLERIAHQPFCVISPCMLMAGLITPILLIKFIWTIEKKTDTRFFSYISGLNPQK